MIVTEVGLNHLGDQSYANQYIDSIIKAKPDAITFQIREKLFYSNKRYSKLILPRKFYGTLIKKVKANGIKFGIAIADKEMIDFFEMTGVDFIQKSKDRFTLIHTRFTNSVKDINLKAIPMLQEKFDIPAAFGNHSNNVNVLYLALGYEPSDLFFYVKGDKVTNHPDEDHAVGLNQLAEIISNLRTLPRSIGSGNKIKMNS